VSADESKDDARPEFASEVHSWWAWIVDNTVAYEGSTRGAAIIRILFPFIIWSRWAGDHLFYKTVDDPIHLLFAVGFFLGGALMVVGLFTRVSVGVMALTMSAWHLYFGHELGMQKALMSVNLWTPVVGLFFTDCGRSLSVDRWLAVRRAKARGEPPPSERGSLWGLRLIAWQVTMMYFWGAFDKTDAQWLAGERMERYWMNFYGSSDYPSWPGARLLLLSSAIGTVVLEYALAVGLWFEKPRRWLWLPGVLMHFSMYIFLPAFQITWQMILCYLAFIPGDRAHDFIDELLGHRPSSGAA